MSNINILSKPKVEMSLRIRRADGTIEDGPKVNVAAGMGFFQSTKLALLVRVQRFLDKILHKLEGMK